MSVFDLHDALTRALPADPSRSKSTTAVITSEEGTPGTPCGLDRRDQVIASCMSYSMQSLTLHPITCENDDIDSLSDYDSDGSGMAFQRQPSISSCSASLLKEMQSQQEEEQNRGSLAGIPAMHPRKPQPMAYQTALGQKDILDMDRDERYLKSRSRLNRRGVRNKKAPNKSMKKNRRWKQLVHKSSAYRDKMKTKALKANRLSKLKG